MIYTKYFSLAQQVLAKSKEKGVSLAEVFLVDSEELTIQVARQQVENLKLAQESGLGLRVIIENRLGYAFTSDLTEGALNKVVEMALYNSRESVSDPNWELPAPPPGGYHEMVLYDEHIFETSIDEKIRLAQKIEEAARSFDSRVKITERTAYQDSRYQICIFNSLGLQAAYRGSYCGGYAVVVGQDNDDNQTGFAMEYVLRFQDLDPEKIGREAGERAIRMLGAKTIPSARMPVVLDPYIATNFLGVLQNVFNGEAVLKGKSFLKGKEGQQIANHLVTIIDDGTMPGRLGSSPFDGEGVPTSATTLVEEGKLKGFLHNSYTAKKFGLKSTGNAVRGSYKGTPEIGITNFYLKPGLVSPGEIVKEIKRGLYITDVMGMHTVNPISGDFSLGASGLLIENGEMTRPVRGVAIAGNLKDFLMDIEVVGNDLTFYVSKGAPTIMIRSMSISGA